jgi:hypothetical protein
MKNRIVSRLKKVVAGQFNCQFSVTPYRKTVKEPEVYIVRMETSGLVAQTSNASDIAKTLNINYSDFELAVKQHGGSINLDSVTQFKFCTFTTTEQAQDFIDKFLVPSASSL